MVSEIEVPVINQLFLVILLLAETPLYRHVYIVGDVQDLDDIGEESHLNEIFEVELAGDERPRG